MASQEQVLVIERKVVEKIGMFEGLAFDVKRYLSEIFVSGVPRFMLRSEAENNPSYKQLIPYVIMTYKGKFLNYVRGKKAGEQRLVAKRSIGIGGHINTVDNSLFSMELYDTYLAAVAREVEEEVIVKTKHTDTIIALLNDDSNDVGKVHLGIVHYWDLDSPDVEKREQMITQMSFMSLQELEEVRDTLETWSQKCLDGLEKMMKTSV